jgi:pimeloyl-ACP methyl ester carboxylesterase
MTRQHLVHVDAGGVTLEGDLGVPDQAYGLVVFAHGSGSSRHSPRNRGVARQLQQARLATLLMDLLTPAEGDLRFDIPLLAQRLVDVTDWTLGHPEIGAIPLGYFGASTGAAAALMAAADRPQAVSAIVSRGGRPDLAGPSLRRVHVPTLLIVGGEDVPVIGFNRQACEELRGERRLVIVPGATHLFEEPGALDVVARLAREWFEQHLSAARHPA